ncbi:ABC transporter ATP-binding protein [Lacihabitans soyangensis]|uniref:ABC transporter ATP-binding protein n=1 Tax=Lacihabitans soyangensis TaxID=869394 RepID=A0AAE3H099_9BACT|nr:ABC transporter ATP-binding protein [Lacihabitans soyangensis]MCP9762312.1 ABC transporter ATP-binding protein [Lacihabitans soyangensis]
MNKNRIVVENLNLWFGKNYILEPINLEVNKNEIVAIFGESGCGKSSLLRSIADLHTVKEVEYTTGGNVLINGLSPSQAKKEKMIGMAFQEHTLKEGTVRDNILLPLNIGRKSIVDTEYYEKLLSLVGLAEYADYTIDTLSGGMKQRVSFARALITKPEVLLLDEPFSALDLVLKTRLMEELSAILNKVQTPTIIVTHTIEEAVFLADRIIILSSKPAKINTEIKVNFPKPRLASIMNSLDFMNTVNTCRNLILNNSKYENL